MAKVEVASEELLLPHERNIQSLGDVHESLFELMESDGIDVLDGSDDPDLNEPAPEDDAEESDDDDDAEDSDESEEDERDDEDESDDDESDDGDRDDESDESDEDEDGDDDGEEDLFELPGESDKKTLQELKDGWLRTADYTRKRQRDSAEHAEAMKSLREGRETYDVRLGKLQETLESLGPAKPEAALRESDPGAYAAQMLEHRDYQDQLRDIGVERGRVDGERQKEIEDLRGEIIGQQRELLFDAVPEWRKDVALAKQSLSDLGDFAQSEYKFTAAEADAVLDHRLILMLRDLKANKDVTSESKKKIAKSKRRRTKSLKPGATRRSGRKSQKKAQRNANQRLAQTGSVRDAARAIELDLD